MREVDPYVTMRSADIPRRIVFFNTVTNNYLLVIEGYCGIEDVSHHRYIDIICKVGDSSYKRHRFGLSKYVSYFVEQIDPPDEEPFLYRVIYY